jgi:phage baseplate assembly protein W
MTVRYKGFSTVNQSKKFKISDLDLVKQDLLNHFSIRKGEKLMQPNFGSLIWNMLYEPLTAEVKAAIISDVQTIVNYDPRLNVNNVLINELDNGVQIQIDLVFLPGNYADSLKLNFDTNAKTVTRA